MRNVMKSPAVGGQAVLGGKKFKKAFTLIELLIVIAIIAILATLIFVNVASARKKARDVKRKADLKNLQTALEMYNEANGSYPTTGSAVWGFNGCGLGNHGVTGPTGYVPNLAPTYVSTLPLDPTVVSQDHCYTYRSNGTDYKLRALNTVEIPLVSTDPFYDSLHTNGRTAQVSTPGAVTW